LIWLVGVGVVAEEGDEYGGGVVAKLTTGENAVAVKS